MRTELIRPSIYFDAFQVRESGSGAPGLNEQKQVLRLRWSQRTRPTSLRMTVQFAASLRWDDSGILLRSLKMTVQFANERQGDSAICE